MASRYTKATLALVASAMIGVAAHQARAGVLIPNIQLLAPWAKFTSVTDPLCSKYWVKHAQNDPALRCYLTTDIARLCNFNERLHLAHTVRRYRWDAAMLAINTVIAAVKPLTMPAATAKQMQQAQEGLSAQINGRPDPNGGMSALRAITEKRMDNIAKARPATLDAALEVEVLAQDELLDPLRTIARAGLMKRGDFGWAPGRLVDEAFQGVAGGRVCGG
jgi:hypothetical protein